MLYAHIINDAVAEYPITEQMIRLRFPDKGFPVVFVPPEDYVAVVETTKPAFNSITQAANETTPVLDAGVWYQTWVVVDLPAEDVAINTDRATSELIHNVTVATQERLDVFAQTRGYDSILSACTYAVSTVPRFQGEGQYCVNARDATWAALYTYMDEVQTGVRPMPSSFADIEPLLPALAWPA